MAAGSHRGRVEEVWRGPREAEGALLIHLQQAAMRGRPSSLGPSDGRGGGLGRGRRRPA
jgi:hypothetical protein